MKTYLVLLGCVLATATLAGPIKMKNEKALRDYQAEKAYEASTNYYSADQYVVDVQAANNFNQLKAAVLKQAKATKAKDKAKKDAKIKK